MSKFTSTWAVVVSVVILLGLKVYNPLPLQTLELKTFDLYQKFGNHYESKSLVLLDISDEALTKEGQWPWKRDVLADVIIKLREAEVGIIVLPILFSEEDRLGGDKQLAEVLQYLSLIHI